VEKLAAFTARMGKTTKRYSAVFIAAGLPTDFIARLIAANITFHGEG
jgi:hypothetical protein